MLLHVAVVFQDALTRVREDWSAARSASIRRLPRKLAGYPGTARQSREDKARAPE